MRLVVPPGFELLSSLHSTISAGHFGKINAETSKKSRALRSHCDGNEPHLGHYEAPLFFERPPMIGWMKIGWMKANKYHTKITNCTIEKHVQHSTDKDVGQFNFRPWLIPTRASPWSSRWAPREEDPRRTWRRPYQNATRPDVPDLGWWYHILNKIEDTSSHTEKPNNFRNLDSLHD